MDWRLILEFLVIVGALAMGPILAPLVTYGFTFAAGMGHIVYPLLPVIYEVAHENGIRPNVQWPLPHRNFAMNKSSILKSKLFLPFSGSDWQ